jgi:hypothetical protein
MKPGRLVLLVSAGYMGWSPAGAQSAGDLSIQVGECVELESAAERYACFERQVDAALAEDPAGASDAEVARSVEGDEPVEVAEQPPSGAQESARSAAEAEQPEQFVSSIAALTERLPNEYVITLENGQTWRQVGAQRYPLRVGHHVRIYPTRWGDSYRLRAEGLNSFIQVERVR